MSDAITPKAAGKVIPEGAHIPSHGRGFLKPIKPGESRNPTGKAGIYLEAQRITREKSPEAARKLVELMDSKDDRVALMAAEKVMVWAWGKPVDYDPKKDRPPMGINTSIMTQRERLMLLELLRRGLLIDHVEEAEAPVVEGEEPGDVIPGDEP